jgi:choline monooxygenase
MFALPSSRLPKEMPMVGNGPPDYRSEETYRATRLPVELATTLLPDAYRSARFHEVEQEQLFARGWVCVGYTSQVADPGQTFVATVAGQPLLITRDRTSGLHAFYNTCRHRGSLLRTEDGSCDVIRCPYHHWGYALDGRLLGAPYFKGLDIPDDQRAMFECNEARGFRKEDYGLLPVAVDSWGCFVFVNLAPNPRPLREWLGDLPERFARHPLRELQLVRRRPFTIGANWKLIAENFMEYYHLPWVHPELCNISGFKDHYRYQGPGMYTGMRTTPLSNDPTTATFELPTMPGLAPTEAQSAYWVLLFPNLALFLLPNHLFTLLFHPDGSVRSLESADLLVHPNALAARDAQSKIDAILSFWGMVNLQDIAAVERVQQGLQSKAYPGGRMCYRFEEPVHRFQNMVIDRMTGAERVPPGDDTEESAYPTAARSGNGHHS